LSPEKSSGGLTAAIAEDLLTEVAEPAAARSEPSADLGHCYSCGVGMVYHGPTDDSSGRFCSDRCRDWFDSTSAFTRVSTRSGDPPWFENPGFRPGLRGENLYGLRGWKVVAGPPGIETGSGYYAPIIEASDRKRAESEGQDLIRPRRVCKCGRRIPVWHKGRKVPSSRQLCFGCSPPRD
jgi:hypothetical protein